MMSGQADGPLANRYTRLIGIRNPVVQEGMGPFSTARLAAAVSEACGLGTVSVPGAVGDLNAATADLRRSVKGCAFLTSAPFAVNIPIGQRRGGVAASALRYVSTQCSRPGAPMPASRTSSGC